MAQIYAVPDQNGEYVGLAETLRAENPATGRPNLTLPWWPPAPC